MINLNHNLSLNQTANPCEYLECDTILTNLKMFDASWCCVLIDPFLWWANFDNFNHPLDLDKVYSVIDTLILGIHIGIAFGLLDHNIVITHTMEPHSCHQSGFIFSQKLSPRRRAVRL